MKKVDPFTRTPGLAGDAFIDTHYADEIIYNFESEKSSKYVYKIVGLRGSGKSVEYRKIVNAMSDKKSWNRTNHSDGYKTDKGVFKWNL